MPVSRPSGIEAMQRAVSLILILCMSASGAGCAAMILKSAPDTPKMIRGGTTLEDLRARLGEPIRSTRIEPPVPAQRIWENDHQVPTLTSDGLAFSSSAFSFKGRLESKARSGQAGFDSFMTLGLAEIYLIPKALWERFTDEELELTVWFNANSEAVAYKVGPA